MTAASHICVTIDENSFGIGLISTCKLFSLQAWISDQFVLSFNFNQFFHHLPAFMFNILKKPSLRWSGQLFKSSEESLQQFLASLFYTVGKVFKARRGGKMLTGVPT